MNHSVETILNHPVMESLGWVLLHFLWQGAAVAAVLFLVLTVLRRVSANARYLISCFALLMTATLPALTWTLLPEPLSRLNKETARQVAIAPVDLPNWTVGDAEAAAVIPNSSGIQTPHNYGVMSAPPAVSSMGDPTQNAVSVLEQLKHWLRPWIPFLTCAWLAGVLTLSTRLLFTWIQVQRLQQRGVQSPRPEHQALLQRLAERLKISRTVRLLESVVVEVPTVIGWLKPAILLPVASVNSLTVQQLEAILAHELAHIRRADYAVNLVQSLIETLLFYHPAVWWMSARIRQEREHCCDDLATSISGDAASYVAALVRMEELRCEPRSVAVAARGGDLLTRAKRLLVPSTPERLAPRWLTGIFAMAIAATIVCVPLLKTSRAEPATTQDAKTSPGNTPEPTSAADEETAAKKIAKKDPEPVHQDEIESGGDYSLPNAQSRDSLSKRRSKYGQADSRERTESELQIEKSLGEKVSLHFHDVALTEVIRHIAKVHGINIAMQTRAIKLEGLAADQPVSIDVDGISLRSALDLLLAQAGGLVYTIENETLMISLRLEPAEIADRIEEARKRYASVEYSATIEQTRNTSAFQPDAKPTLVKGTGSVVYRADGERWFCDRASSSYQTGSTKTYPTQIVSSFDGSIHRVLERNVLKICQEDNGADQYAPAEFFWKGGISPDWVLGALRRPEAKLIERIQMAETSCLNVRVEWKPAGSEKERSFDIMICPEQGWLVRRVIIEDGGELLAEWSIAEVAKTESGLHYPVEFKVIRPEADDTPSTIVNISKFQERTDFEPHEFQVPNRIGTDIVDYRSGFAWHNDPWWNELGSWARENLDWPQPDLRPLASFQSYSPPELAGKAAPELVPGEWLNRPGKLTWDRPERTVTVLYFFGGRLIEPTPEQVAALSHLQRKYADGGLEIIGIASHYETPEMTRQAIRELVPSFPVMIDAKANDADISKDIVGADWGANFVQYQLRPYTGTVVVNKAGKITLLGAKGGAIPSGMSELESLVRDELLNVHGTSDPPSLRQSQVNRFSRLLRGHGASVSELNAAVADPSKEWLQTAQLRISAGSSDFLNLTGLKHVDIVEELASTSSAMPRVAWYRLENEWKKRAAATVGKGTISGRILQFKDPQLQRDKTKVFITPVLQFLTANVPGVRELAYDKNRVRQTETDQDGLFIVKDLPKGSYRVTVDVVGKPRVRRMVHLITNESSVGLNIVLSDGATITGQVTDVAGKAIPGAVIKPVKRYATQEAFDAGQHTTEDLPPEIQSDNGRFTFDRLFEGAYQFRVSAEGFKTTTTEPVAAGTALLPVVLKPAVQDQ